ncbi:MULTISPECIES: SDR family oxidoreductase [Clostridium]|uniref:SDR family NAD(P)-dependent oxidoreductase n=1 Tax=Clostridium TaxID=1485 RepID=UPI001A9B7248|nr:MULTISPECIES: SDR family oxidoreductase [Clostridium]MDU1349166.1 SDR family oxidoreductase [Clostridium argentinense]
MKYTLITGATSGIGYELSKVFGENGHNLILCGRDIKRLEELKREFQCYSRDIIVVTGDLSNVEDINKMYKFIEENNYEVEFLINNAGLGSFGSLSETLLERELNLIDVNIRAVLHLTKLFLPNMVKKNSGGILNVSSTAAFSPGPFMNNYYASKAYILSFTEGLREELKHTNIKVSVLCPGPTATNFQERAEVKKADFAKKALMEPRLVAKIAYKKFMKNKLIIVPGINNKILVGGSKVIPNRVLSRIIRKVNNNK